MKHYCHKTSDFYGVCIHIIFDKLNNQRKNLPMSLEPLLLTVENKPFMVKPFIGYFCIKYGNSLKKIFMNPLHITFQRLSGVQIHTPIYYVDELFEIIDELHISHPFFTSKVKGKVFIYSNSVEFKDLREISESNEMIYESSIINETETLESKFKLVYSDKIINEVCDLSLNSKMYFSDNHKLIYPKSYEATDFMFQLDEFISSNHLYTNYFLFCGNKGIGKTTNLLWNLRNNPQCKSLYLDIKILTSYKYTKEEKSEMIKNEFIYLFNDDEIEKYKEFCFNLIDKEIINHSFDFISNILEYLHNNNKNVLIVFDHFNSDINNRTLSSLIRYSSQQMKIIICANINNTIKEHLLSQFDNISKKKSYHLYYYPKLNTPLTEVQSNDVFTGIPKYIYKKQDATQFKEKIKSHFLKGINDEEDYIITFESLYSLVINIDKEISLETLKTIIKDYPLKYFVISQITQCVFKLNYSFTLVRLGLFYALDISFNKIKEKKQFVESTIMRDHLYKGILLEYSIHHFMKEGALFNKLLITGIIEVDTIEKFTLIPQKIPQNKNVLYFKQKDFFGPKYDSAFVFKTNGINKLVLFQITRCKNTNKIVSKEEAKEDCQSIISILSKSLDITITINNCFLYFIFATEFPDKNAITYCQNHSIGTLLFSIKEEKFTTTTFSEDIKLGENHIFSVTANPPKWNNTFNAVNESIKESESEIQSFLQKKTNRANTRKSNKKENKIKGDDMKKFISEVGKGNFESSSVQDFVLIYQKQKKGILVKEIKKYKIQYNAEIQELLNNCYKRNILFI